MGIDAEHLAGDAQRGFTLMEMMIVISMLGILALMAYPRVATILTHERVNQAAGVVAQDLDRAVSAAARQRRPVRIALGADNQSYTITDRASGATIWQRPLGDDEYHVESVSFSASPVDVFPTGFTSGALTVTVTARGYSRSVSMSTAGWVRVP